MHVTPHFGLGDSLLLYLIAGMYLNERLGPELALAAIMLAMILNPVNAPHSRRS